MDPITHAVAGLALGTLSGEPLSLSNPIYLSAMLGAVAPDIDVLWGYKKLKRRRDLPTWLQHRALTHSLVGMPVLALAVAGGLSLLFPQSSFWMMLLFASIGVLSHTLLDLMNCYGVNVLWPICKKPYSFNIVPLVDPLLIVFMLSMIASVNRVSALPPTFFAVLLAYVCLRGILFVKARRLMSAQYAVKPKEIQMIPPPISLRRWDFYLTHQESIEGQVVCFPRISFMEDPK